MIKGYTEILTCSAERAGKKVLAAGVWADMKGTITLVKAREKDVATIGVQGGETYVPVTKQLPEYISPQVFSS